MPARPSPLLSTLRRTNSEIAAFPQGCSNNLFKLADR
jgi:hypothetical protein